MDEKSLYAHILNLSRSVAGKVPFSMKNAGSVTVTIEIAENNSLACPTCGKSCSVHDHRHRKWRHLDTCQFTTIVEADVPRIIVREHGCLTLPVPWAGWKPVYVAIRIVRSLMAEKSAPLMLSVGSNLSSVGMRLDGIMTGQLS